MALINCPECGKEISDKVNACPSCGYPMTNEENLPQQVEITSVNLSNGNRKKIIIGAGIIVLAIIMGLIIAYMYNIDKTNTYIDDLKLLRDTSLDGASKAEELSILTINVWSNSIFEETSEETDKYTLTSFGDFNSDFNDSLENLFSDSETQEKVSTIEANQKKVSDIMKDLQNPPKKLKSCYATATELYSSYQSLTNLAINPKGSLQDYGDSKSEKVDSYMEQFDKLEAQIPKK